MDFADFVDAHSPRLLRVAYLLTGEQFAAEDLLQEALIRIGANWDKVSAAASLSGYSRKVLVNQHLALVRRRSLPVTPLAGDLPEATDFVERLTAQDELRRALILLPGRQRCAVVLRYYEQLEVEEIARIMRIRPSSVRSSIARGVATLNTLLTESQHEESEHARR